MPRSLAIVKPLSTSVFLSLPTETLLVRKEAARIDLDVTITNESEGLVTTQNSVAVNPIEGLVMREYHTTRHRIKLDRFDTGDSLRLLDFVEFSYPRFPYLSRHLKLT